MLLSEALAQMHPFTHDVLEFFQIAPNQGNGNLYRVISLFILLGKLINDELKPADLLHIYHLKYHKANGGFYLQRKAGADELFPKLSDKDATWDKFPLIVSGNWEFPANSSHKFKKPLHKFNKTPGLGML